MVACIICTPHNVHLYYCVSPAPPRIHRFYNVKILRSFHTDQNETSINSGLHNNTLWNYHFDKANVWICYLVLKSHSSGIRQFKCFNFTIIQANWHKYHSTINKVNKADDMNNKKQPNKLTISNFVL